VLKSDIKYLLLACLHSFKKQCCQYISIFRFFISSNTRWSMYGHIF